MLIMAWVEYYLGTIQIIYYYVVEDDLIVQQQVYLLFILIGELKDHELMSVSVVPARHVVSSNYYEI